MVLMMQILFLILGLVLGCILSFLFTKQQQIKLQTQLKFNEDAKTEALNNLKSTTELLQEQSKKQARLETEKESLLEKLANQKEELITLNQKMQVEFENLANRIIDEKSKKFSDQNQQNLNQILNPLKDKIKDFEDKVQRHYEEETREKASLKQQIIMLHDLNQKMSTDAQNLTKALKGDTKTQGN
jgi:DNA recombination protein RmuC